MGDLSPNFSRWEFACQDKCGLDTVDKELIDVLQDLSDFFDNRPVGVSSGCRCPKRNLEEDGADDSQHLVFKAADVTIEGIEAYLVFEYIGQKYPDKYGVGEYKTFTHIDVRESKARW